MFWAFHVWRWMSWAWETKEKTWLLTCTGPFLSGSSASGTLPRKLGMTGSWELGFLLPAPVAAPDRCCWSSSSSPSSKSKSSWGSFAIFAADGMLQRLQLRIHKLNPGIDRSIDLPAAVSPAADPEACKRRSEDRQNPIPEDSGSLVSDRMWSNRSRGRTLINNNTKHNNYRKFETYIFINK